MSVRDRLTALEAQVLDGLGSDFGSPGLPPGEAFVLAATLIRHEGAHEEPYEDALGHLTIGVGHWLEADERYELPMSAARMSLLLREDIAVAVQDAQAWLGEGAWSDAPGTVCLVLANLSFNVGAGTLAEFKRLRRAVRRGNYARASRELVDSEWHGQVGRRGPELAALLTVASMGLAATDAQTRAPKAAAGYNAAAAEQAEPATDARARQTAPEPEADG